MEIIDYLEVIINEEPAYLNLFDMTEVLFRKT